MFLVQKPTLSSPFRSTTKKPPHIPKSYHLTSQLFDQKLLHHLKTLDLTQNSSNSSILSLSWLSAAVSFLKTVHTEAEDQISCLKSETDDFHGLYMDYSVKVLDLCNLISSAVNKLTERRLLLNYSLRLLNFTDRIPCDEKLNKAKDALHRSVKNCIKSDEESVRAKALVEDLAVLIGKVVELPRGKTSVERDLIRRTFHGIGLLTVLIGSVLVAGVFGEPEVVRLRVPTEFMWCDSVNGMFDRVELKCDAVLEVGDVARQAVVVGELIEGVVDNGGGGDDGDGVRVRLEDGVKELVVLGKKFSDGVDGLTNGVNGLFRCVLKTRNGGLVNSDCMSGNCKI